MSRNDIEEDPLWYKDAIVYQVHLRAFADSDGDGSGDFRGLASKLDYLRDLGVTAVWLLPFYPSPLRDDGYDIADYSGVHPDYGSLADVRHFLREAHRRGLRVITELVLNHTSDQHPWFQRARRAPAGSPAREFYVWSDSSDRYREARIIFKDFESSNWSWDPVAQAYFWHRFYHHQPDLNYENPEVKKAMFQVVDQWLGMGVDGLRLDAVPYLYEREGTNCENLSETHGVLKELREYVDARFRGRMLLAEANQWPEDAVAYLGAGDECHMAFHFPVMPRMFMALRMEDRYPILDILAQTPQIPDSCQWAVFLRNHDELTLEMVTDEERDYMYRVYANDPRARINLGIRRRLAPLLENNRRRIELMNGLLFSLPGTPVLYYGDEIGMGDNIYLGDRNAVRTPMQWSGDRNAGFSKAPAQRLFLPVVIEADFHYESVNVEAHQNNPSSLLWWTKRLIALRKRHKAFGRGTLEFLYPENRKVLAFLRRHDGETILVVANLSRYAQYVELDLSAYRGRVPEELFGATPFPRIGELPYLLTMGPHGFYWFSLGADAATEPGAALARTVAPVAELRAVDDWYSIFRLEYRAAVEEALPRFLRAKRWFGGKARHMTALKIADVVPLEEVAPRTCLALVRVEYTEGDPETYSLPLAFVVGDDAQRLVAEGSSSVVARLETKSESGILVDAVHRTDFCEGLLDAVARRRLFRGEVRQVAARPTRAFKKLRGTATERLVPTVLRGEQSNTSILYGDRLVLKLFRRIGEGVNPDLELGEYLTEKAAFANAPAVAGALEYRAARGEPVTLAILQELVRNEADAWRYSLDILDRYLERVTAVSPESVPDVPDESPLALARCPAPDGVREWVGVYLESARLLGTRTAELHMALASDGESPAFSPEPFTPLYQRSLYQSFRNHAVQSFELLRKSVESLPEDARADAKRLLAAEAEILARFREVVDRGVTALRTRVHGDYHLGQVLHTGKDFVIIDFEGEPSHSLSTRRIKRSPLRDVAGMLRSFDYAAFTALLHRIERGVSQADERLRLERWADYWTVWVSSEFLRSYLAAAGPGGFLPASPDELERLLDAYLLEKALYETVYELNNRPDWIRIPLRGALRLLRSGAR